MGTRFFAHRAAPLAAVVFALACLALTPAAQAAPLAGSSFDTGDGDQENGLHLDWQGAAATGRAVEAPDPNAADSCYVGGTKETTPDNWAFNTSAGGCTPGKSNIRAAWANPESVAATTFAHFAFWRNDTSGNSFLTFELNQTQATWVNRRGTTIPCRTNGDVLLSFESAGGSALATAVYKWTGDGTGPAACPNGASGSFTSSGQIGGSSFQGSMNAAAIFNYLNPAEYGGSFLSNSFGEAAIDLPAVLQTMGDSPCFGFLQMQVHSRSSSSISSALIDTTSPVPVYLQSCAASGHTYQDDNGNGVRDAAEPGLPGFTFYVDLDGDGAKDPGEPSGTSDSDGFYRILDVPAGTYEIRQVDQDGWNCTGPAPCVYTRTFTTAGNSTGNDFGNAAPSTVSGVKFDDLDGDGVQDGGEPGLAGFTFYVDYDGDGVREPGEPVGVSDDAGAWTIANVESGTYAIREAEQPGWTCSVPAPCSYTQSFSSGSSVTGLTFGNWDGASISGTVFEDLDGDGAAREGGEPALSGWQVYVDADGDDEFDFGEPATMTDASGNYVISGLAPGSRTVRATPPSGSWYCTLPGEAALCERTVALTSGDAAAGQALGFTRHSTVSGTKFEDANNNGVKDGSEAGTAGFVFYVDYDNDDTLDAGEPQATSAATTGAWTITGVKAGAYPVREVPQAGWTCTQPAATCRYDLSIGSGSTHTGSVFGNYIVRSVSGTVFRDGDADAVAREPGEPPLEGWTVYADANGNSTFDAGEIFDVTNAEGFYILTGLPNGAYRLKLVDQPDWTCSFPSGCLNSGSLGNSANASDAGKDFGVWGPATISGTAFEDVDADGSPREPGEPGLAGRTLYIDVDNDGVVDLGEPSATTDASGGYAIPGVNPGTYTVRQVLPAGWTCSSPSPCSYSVTVAGENVTARDFGSWTTGTVAGQLYEDADADGERDLDEGALSGWTVYVDLDGSGTKDLGEPETATDSAGAYEFARAPGDYTVRVVTPVGWTCSAPEPCAYEGTVVSSGSEGGRSFGFHTTGAISGTVYEDSDFDGQVTGEGEPGLANETVYIDADDDGVLDDGEPSATTDGAGAYAFTALPPGRYAVRLAAKQDWTCSFPGDCRIEVDVSSQATESGADFGTYLGADVAGTVFEDLDADGEPREPGEEGLEGERVFLDSDLDGVRDASEPTTLTDSNGAYSFDGIEVQEWEVRVVLRTDWTCDSPTPCRFPVVLTSGAAESGLDFGLHAAGSISGHLYTDRDNDQEPQEFGENDQPGRTVYVDLNENSERDDGEPAAQTDGGGDYTIPGLEPGTYRVRQVLPTGWTCSTPIPCDWQVTLTSRASATGHDFSSWTNAVFTGRQFEDLDGDGEFPEEGEPGLAGRVVYIDSDVDGILDDGEPRTTTDGGGWYAFADIAPGTHIVRSAAPPAQWQLSYPDGGAWQLTLEANESAQEIDFGSYTTGTVTGRAFHDLDADGSQDAGEGGLADRTMYADLDGNGQRDDGEPATATGADGAYELALDPGSYTVREEGRAAWTCSAPSPCSYEITISSSGAYGGRDFGSWTLGTVSGRKFEDLDADSAADAGEHGLTDWTVYADLDGDGERDDTEPAATTDPSGGYTLALDPGTYVIREVTASGWTCSTPSSCAYTVEVESSGNDTGRDFGGWRQGTISGTVFEDGDGDGGRDAGEIGVGGRTVFLDTDDDGDHDTGEPSAATAADGSYSFAVDPGTYDVRTIVPADWTQSHPQGKHRVTVSSSGVAAGVDFGAWRLAAISGTSFADDDRDGRRDAGERARAGRTSYLDANGNGRREAGEPHAESGAGGSYAFAGLAPGPYTVRHVVPAGWTCSAPAGCAHSVTVASGQEADGRDFGAWRAPDPEPPAAKPPVVEPPAPPKIGSPVLWPERGSDGGAPNIQRERDPETGGDIYRIPRTGSCTELRIEIPIDAEPGTIEEVLLVLSPADGTSQETIELSGADGVWTGTIACAVPATLDVVVVAPGGETRVRVGAIVLVDPEPELDADGGCLLRPVTAGVRGRNIRRVVFFLDGRRIKKVSRPQRGARFRVTVDRRPLARGRHVLRAKVVFKRRAQRRPAFLKLPFKRCVRAAPPKVVRATPRPGCGERPFRAWVRGDRIRRVAFRLDGRRLEKVKTADWRGRYAVTVDPTTLRKGRHVVKARVKFVRKARIRTRTVRLTFRKCR